MSHYLWAAPPTDLDLPGLAAACERRGIPLLRVDRHGQMRLVRTAKELDQWKN